MLKNYCENVLWWVFSQCVIVVSVCASNISCVHSEWHHKCTCSGSLGLTTRTSASWQTPWNNRHTTLSQWKPTVKTPEGSWEYSLSRLIQKIPLYPDRNRVWDRHPTLTVTVYSVMQSHYTNNSIQNENGISQIYVHIYNKVLWFLSTYTLSEQLNVPHYKKHTYTW